MQLDVLIRDRVDNLVAEGVDLAVRFGEPEVRALDKKLLLHSPVLTCASAHYVAGHGAPATPQDILQEHTCARMFNDITGKPHSWNFVNRDGEEQVLAPNCGLTLNDGPSLVAVELNHFWIVRLLDFVAADHLRDCRLVEVLPNWNHSHGPGYLYAPAQAQQSHAIEALRLFIRSNTEAYGSHNPRS